MTRKRADDTLTPQQRGGRIGVQRRNAKYSSAEIGDFGRKGFDTLVRRKLQEMLREGEFVEDLTPQEYARRYEAAKRAYMLEIAYKSKLKRGEAARSILREVEGIVLLTACPMCNGEKGRLIPEGVPQALCVHHFFAAQRAGFGHILDEVQSGVPV